MGGDDGWRAMEEEEDEAKLVLETSKGVERIMSFEDMGIKDGLLRGIFNYGLKKPCAIQQHAVAPIISGRDVIVQAQSVTSMIALAVCQIVDTKLKSSEVQAIILSPTREQASETEKVIMAIGECINVQAHACVEVVSGLFGDLRKLEHGGVEVVTGTPATVCDLIKFKRGTLRTTAIKLLILDECDEMLRLGFRDLIYDVHRYLPPQLQVVLISASLPDETLEITRKLMTHPVCILVKRDELSMEGMEHFSVAVEREVRKFDILSVVCDMLLVGIKRKESLISQAVIFCNTKSKVDWLTAKIREKYYLSVSSMHGAMPEKERDAVMADFRCAQTRLLVTTDVWARVLALQQVSLVINYDLPNHRELYIHRIGRTRGVAINFVKRNEMKIVRDIARYYGIQMEEVAI